MARITEGVKPSLLAFSPDPVYRTRARAARRPSSQAIRPTSSREVPPVDHSLEKLHSFRYFYIFFFFVFIFILTPRYLRLL